jgi:hypothetical protein
VRKDRTVELECVACTHATDKALLVHVPQVEEPTWVPISQVSEDSEVQRKGDEGMLIVSRWLAEQKGWV